MSDLVDRHKNFLYLLADTPSRAQKKALVETISPEQFRALSQVVVNALQLNIPVDKSVVIKLQSQKKIFTILSDRNLGARKRLKAFQSRYNPVILLLKAAVPTLKTIVKNE